MMLGKKPILVSLQCIFKEHHLRNMNYDFRSQTDCELGPIYTTGYGLRSSNYFAPKIWNIVPIGIRNFDSLSGFTTKKKSWKHVTCPCNLCRTLQVKQDILINEGLLLNMYISSLTYFNYSVVTEAVTERNFLKMYAPSKLIDSLSNTCEGFVFW